MASILITLTSAGTGTGPFDLYSNVNGYSRPFEIGVSKSALTSGYTSTAVPNGTTIIRVKSTSAQCTNSVDISVTGITTTTTSTTTTTTIPSGGVELVATFDEIASVILYKNGIQYLQINKKFGSEQVSGTLVNGDTYYVRITTPVSNAIINAQITGSVSGIIYESYNNSGNTSPGTLISPTFTKGSEDIYVNVSCLVGPDGPNS